PRRDLHVPLPPPRRAAPDAGAFARGLSGAARGVVNDASAPATTPRSRSLPGRSTSSILARVLVERLRRINPTAPLCRNTDRTANAEALLSRDGYPDYGVARGWQPDGSPVHDTHGSRHDDDIRALA